MTINTTSIKDELRPGLKAVFGTYAQFPTQWSHLYETHSSDKAWEEETEMRFLGLGQIKNEGAPVAFQDMGQMFKTKSINRTLGLGFTITEEAMEDNLYKDKFPQTALALRTSLEQAKEVLGASVFNNGFNNAYPIADGKPVFSTDHPIFTGTVANTFAVQADLNEASLEAALIAVQKFRDAAGLTINTKAQKLVVSAQGQFVADRLLASTYRPGTPNNDVNSINHMSMLPKGVVVNQYLTNPNAWFVFTNCIGAFKHYVRKKVETSIYSDFATNNLLCKAIERYSFVVANFRGGFGSEGAA